jgi:hypothetical protein
LYKKKHETKLEIEGHEILENYSDLCGYTYGTIVVSIEDHFFNLEGEGVRVNNAFGSKFCAEASVNRGERDPSEHFYVSVLVSDDLHLYIMEFVLQMFTS